MKLYGRAEEVAEGILQAFERGEIPKALAQMFINFKGDIPCRAWSWLNQMVVALAGHADARGIRQWNDVGRRVKKGEHATFILVPIIKKNTKTNEEGEEVEDRRLIGFKSAPVFGYSQTKGEPLPGQEEQREFIDALPLVNVAKAWGLSVATFNGKGGRYLGRYRQGQAIALGVKNLSTWTHELIHAADDRLNGLKPGQRLDQETVAEFGGAVLLEALGYEREADRGGCWEYVKAYADKEKKNPLTVCIKLLNRVCKAVSLILETAEGAGTDPEPSGGGDKPQGTGSERLTIEEVRQKAGIPPRWTVTETPSGFVAESPTYEGERNQRGKIVWALNAQGEVVEVVPATVADVPVEPEPEQEPEEEPEPKPVEAEQESSTEPLPQATEAYAKIETRIDKVCATTDTYRNGSTAYVQLTPADNQVILTATDGHILAIVEAQGEANGECYIPPAVLPTRKGVDTVIFNGEEWRTESGKFAPPPDEEIRYPRCRDVLPNLDGGQGTICTIGLNPKLLLTLAENLMGYNAGVVLHIQGPGKPIAVVGERGIGVIMPTGADANESRNRWNDKRQAYIAARNGAQAKEPTEEAENAGTDAEPVEDPEKELEAAEAALSDF